MLRKILIFLLFLFFSACSDTSNLSQAQDEEFKKTNFVNLVTSIEEEETKNGKYYYIDGNVEGIRNINSVKLFCREKNGKLVQELNGTYNSDRFSFTLQLTEGEYILTIEATDEHGNKYIQKNISLQVK